MPAAKLSARLIRLALALTCLGSAMIPVVAFDLIRPLGYLQQSGVPDGAQMPLFLTFVVLDLCLTGWILLGRARGVAWGVGAVTLSYTLAMSVCVPEEWLDPFGALLKNLVILAACPALVVLEEGAGHE